MAAFLATFVVVAELVKWISGKMRRVPVDGGLLAVVVPLGWMRVCSGGSVLVVCVVVDLWSTE